MSKFKFDEYLENSVNFEKFSKKKNNKKTNTKKDYRKSRKEKNLNKVYEDFR